MEATDKEIIGQFEKFGLTKYEAKAYLTLLRGGESYGGEISKNSGIPGSKVYETLDRLVEKGLAYPIPGTPVRYQSLPLKDFLNIKQKDFERTLKFLEEKKEFICKPDTAELLWYLTGRERLIDKAAEIIDSAASEVLISLWPEEASELRANLEKADQRNVAIVSIQFNQHCLNIGKVYKHISVPAVRERHGSEMFLSVDRSKCMFMFFEDLHGWKGFYTSSKGICRVIDNYIKHDIYINRIITEHQEYIFKHYGERVEKLLEI